MFKDIAFTENNVKSILTVDYMVREQTAKKTINFSVCDDLA